MKLFLKILALVAVSLVIMHILQYILETYVKIPRDYANDIITYPGIVVTVLIMNVLGKKGWL